VQLFSNAQLCCGTFDKGLTTGSNASLPQEETPWAHPSLEPRLRCAAGFLLLSYGVFTAHCGMYALHPLQESALEENVIFGDRLQPSRSVCYSLEAFIYIGFFVKATFSSSKYQGKMTTDK
jgi:hypothetical protein